MQGIGVVLLAWASYRRAGTTFMLLMLGALGLAYTGLDDLGQFTHAWNPYAALPYFVLFLVLVWAAALGNRWSIVGTLAAGTFVVQCHVGYSPLVLVALAWAAILGRRRTAHAAGRRAPLVGGARVRLAMLVVLWLPPVIQELRDRPGNLTALWDYFREGGDTIGLRAGAGLFATEFRIIPPWFGGGESYGFGTATPRRRAVAGCSSRGVAGGRLARGAPQRTARRPATRRARRARMSVVGVLALSRLTIEPAPLRLLLARRAGDVRRRRQRLGDRTCT